MKTEIRPLTEKFWRAAARLTRSLAREQGIALSRSFKADLAIYASPWLGRAGKAHVLLAGTELVGLGWARDECLWGREVVHTGLFLAPSARTPERYRPFTDRLLASAARVGRTFGMRDNVAIYRAIDTIHPPIIRTIGFRDLPMTMIGYRHDLLRIPERPLPPGIRVRPARLPGELPEIIEFARRCFDDPETQGNAGHPDRWQLLLAELTADPELLLLAEHADGLVGYAAATVNYAPRGAAVIGECGVLPSLRRRGTASHLGCRLLQHCRQRRLHQVLISEPGTSPAGALLWRLGFRPDALRSYYYFGRKLD